MTTQVLPHRFRAGEPVVTRNLISPQQFTGSDAEQLAKASRAVERSIKILRRRRERLELLLAALTVLT